MLSLSGYPVPAECGTVQIKEGLEEDSQLITHERFQEIVVPWIMQNEAHLVREGFHRLMRAFKALDPDCKGYIDAQVLKTTLMTQVRAPGVLTQVIHQAPVWYNGYLVNSLREQRALRSYWCDCMPLV